MRRGLWPGVLIVAAACTAPVADSTAPSTAPVATTIKTTTTVTAGEVDALTLSTMGDLRPEPAVLRGLGLHRCRGLPDTSITRTTYCWVSGHEVLVMQVSTPEAADPAPTLLHHDALADGSEIYVETYEVASTDDSELPEDLPLHERWWWQRPDGLVVQLESHGPPQQAWLRDEALLDLANSLAVDHDEPEILSPPPPTIQASPPIVGIDHASADFLGGASVLTASGHDYELEWRLFGSNVEVSRTPMPAEHFVDYVEQTAGGSTISEYEIRNHTGYGFETQQSMSMFIWYENGAAINVRLRPIAERADEILSALGELAIDEVLDMGGQIYLDIDEAIIEIDQDKLDSLCRGVIPDDLGAVLPDLLKAAIRSSVGTSSITIIGTDPTGLTLRDQINAILTTCPIQSDPVAP